MASAGPPARSRPSTWWLVNDDDVPATAELPVEPPAVRWLGVDDTRTRASNGANAVGAAARSYLGGRSEATARSTFARPTPNCRATCRRHRPQAA